jgi:hypothetical protein
MLIAQAAGEYGVLTALASGLANTWSFVEEQARQTEPTTWLFVAIGLAVVWFIFRR